MTLKPFSFCCSIDDIDPLTKYNRQKSLYKTSLISIHAINGGPSLKFQAQFIDSEQKKRIPKTKLLDSGNHKHKISMKYKQTLHNLQNITNLHKLHNPHVDSHQHIRVGSSYDNLKDLSHFRNLRDGQIMNLLHRPIKWYLEDEIAFAKDTVWKQKQKLYNKEMDKNIYIGKQRSKYMYFNLVVL